MSFGCLNIRASLSSYLILITRLSLNTPASMSFLDQLLECAIDRRARFSSLVEVNRGDGTFSDTLGSEFEFLGKTSV